MILVVYVVQGGVCGDLIFWETHEEKALFRGLFGRFYFRHLGREGKERNLKQK